MMGKFKIIGSAILFFITISAFQNCAPSSGVKFQEATSASTSSTAEPSAQPAQPTETCTTTLQKTAANLRVLFMVDDSGSTQTTDAGNVHRVATIKKFLTNYGSSTGLSYQYGYFSASYALWYDNLKRSWTIGNTLSSSTTTSGTTTPTMASFFNAEGLQNALTAFTAGGLPYQYGGTPYSAAISAIQNEIKNDIAVNGSKFSYAVVFMSDGAPSPSLTVTQLQNLVSSLVVTAGGSDNITFSAVYFGPESDATAIGNLKAMVDVGKGQFVDSNLTTDVVISDVITVPVKSCTTN